MEQYLYLNKLQELRHQIESLKREYINSLPFKEGDFVKVKCTGKQFEVYILEVYMPIYETSGKYVNLLVSDSKNGCDCYIISCVRIQDIEIKKTVK